MKFTDINDYKKALSDQQRQCYDQLVSLIREVYPESLETLFVSQPYFSLPKHEAIKSHHRPSIMLTFFGDHVNVFSMANASHQGDFPHYRFTDKHTMQIKLDQVLETEKLKALFRDALVDRR